MPAIDAMLMMRPHCRFSMSRPAACANRNAPVRLTSTTFCHFSSGMSSGSAAQVTPALLTRMSTLPKAAIVRCRRPPAPPSGLRHVAPSPSTRKPRLAQLGDASASATARAARTASATRRLRPALRPSPAESARSAGDDGDAAGEVEQLVDGRHATFCIRGDCLASNGVRCRNRAPAGRRLQRTPKKRSLSVTRQAQRTRSRAPSLPDCPKRRRARARAACPVSRPLTVVDERSRWCAAQMLPVGTGPDSLNHRGNLPASFLVGLDLQGPGQCADRLVGTSERRK